MQLRPLQVPWMRGWRKQQQLKGLPNSQRQNEEGSRAVLAVHTVCSWDGRCRRRAAAAAVTGFEVKEHSGTMSPTRKCRGWLQSPRANPICLVIRSILQQHRRAATPYRLHHPVMFFTSWACEDLFHPDHPLLIWVPHNSPAPQPSACKRML